MRKQIVCQFHDLSHDGEGVGKFEEKIIFVDGVLPYEKARVEIREEKKTYQRGTLLQLIELSSDRVKPICDHFSLCGGCQIMHLREPIQLEFKRKRVLKQLDKIGGIRNMDFPVEIYASDSTLFYRNKVEWQIQNGKIGYFEKHSHQLLPINQCWIIQPLLRRFLQYFQDHISKYERFHRITIRVNQEETEATCIFHSKSKSQAIDDHLSFSFPEIVGILIADSNQMIRCVQGRPYLNERVLGYPFQVQARSFLQINLKQAEKLYLAILDQITAFKSRIVLDAYCGIGILACLIGLKGITVYGFDIVPEAIESAENNSLALGLINVNFQVVPFEKSQNFPISPDTVILNPPRSGLDPLAYEQVKRLSPQFLIYVSCDPATLARDLKVFIEQGYYLKNVLLFDLFPQTMHVETLVVLEKN